MSDICSICLEPEGEFSQIWCGHRLHLGCLFDMIKLTLQLKCPLCRAVPDEQWSNTEMGNKLTACLRAFIWLHADIQLINALKEIHATILRGLDPEEITAMKNECLDDCTSVEAADFFRRIPDPITAEYLDGFAEYSAIHHRVDTYTDDEVIPMPVCEMISRRLDAIWQIGL